jgi:hypothetical protein
MARLFIWSNDQLAHLILLFPLIPVIAQKRYCLCCFKLSGLFGGPYHLRALHKCPGQGLEESNQILYVPRGTTARTNGKNSPNQLWVELAHDRGFRPFGQRFIMGKDVPYYYTSENQIKEVY